MVTQKCKSYEKVFYLTIFLMLIFGNTFSQDEDTPIPEIGIYERLGETLPKDIILTDESGQQVNLKSLVTKPTIFSLVYFKCPGICSPLLNGMTKAVDKADLVPGVDYNLITVSFDTTDGYQLAAEKKQNYMNELSRKIPPDSWRFLTGDSANTKKITDALGFKYKREGVDFIHSAAIMVVSPDGKIVRYLYGTDYLPFDFKMAVTEASEGRVVPSINKLVKMCFSFDPDGRRYVLNFTRIAGGGMILLLGAFVIFITRKNKKNKTNINKVNTI